MWNKNFGLRRLWSENADFENPIKQNVRHCVRFALKISVITVKSVICTLFYFGFSCRYKNKSYLCIVFFMVLDF